MLIGDPVMSDRGTDCQEFLDYDQPIDGRPSPAPVLDRQVHAERTLGCEISRELGVGVAAHAQTGL
ncbi:hypothetical protein QOZ89_45260 [Pseudofrankia sp. BMG5.37]|nr:MULTISPECIES: hypothetical protein [unclassified Pseudofrankia]MDT3446723.1 hypothetical protein [Pseudofrankia sp. BMG5.37]OHV57539.1 hypothetical protein BCD48_43040 [Pseudofrankia sp. BMG5.36]